MSEACLNTHGVARNSDMQCESDGDPSSGLIASRISSTEDEILATTAPPGGLGVAPPGGATPSRPRPSPVKASSFRRFGLSRLLRWHKSPEEATSVGSKILGEAMDKGHVNAPHIEHQHTGSQLFRTSLLKGRLPATGLNPDALAPVYAKKPKPPLAQADWPSADPTSSEDEEEDPTDDSSGQSSARLVEPAQGRRVDNVCQDFTSLANHHAAPTTDTSVDDLTCDFAAATLASTPTKAPETRGHMGAFHEAARNLVPPNTAQWPTGDNVPASRTMQHAPSKNLAGGMVPQVTAHRAAWVPDALEPPFFKPTSFGTTHPAPTASLPPSPSRTPRLSFMQRITRRSWGSRTSRDLWVPNPDQCTGDPGPQQGPNRHADPESDHDVPDFWTTTPYPTREPPSTPPRTMRKLTLSPMTANRTVERAEVAAHSPALVELVELVESQRLERRESSDAEAGSTSSARVYSPLKTAMLGRKGWLRCTQLVPRTGPAKLESRSSAYRTAPGRLTSKGVTSRWPGWVTDEWYNSCHPVPTAEADGPCDPRGSLDGGGAMRDTHPTPAGQDQVAVTCDLAERAPDVAGSARKLRDSDVWAPSARQEPVVPRAPEGLVAVVSAPLPQLAVGQRSLLDVTASRLNANASPDHAQSRKDWQASMHR